MDIIATLTQHSFIIFLSLGTAKLIVEMYAKKNIHTGGAESSQGISIYFIFIGSVTPLMILAEIFFLRHLLPLGLCAIFAILQAGLLVMRYLSIRELGRFYSVNVRIDEDHTLVETGIYKYLRHPIYFVGLLENVVYPLACSAYVTAVILFIIDTPAIFYRRAQEEKALIKKFGAAYEDYQKTTRF